MMGRNAAIAGVLALYVAGPALAGGDRPPRRVYVLHSGVHILFAHPDKNHAALVLRDELKRRAVPERDIVVLDCPYPEASWKKPVPWDGVVQFLDSVSTRSKVAQDAYRCMHQALRAHQVGPGDEIVWIGHSAGGQMGLTMAHLAAKLDEHPDLAKAAKRYRFHTVVTLGTPVGCDDVPANVRVLHYISPQDKIVRVVCDLGPWLLPQMGYSCKFRPCSPALAKNCLTRLWHGVEHPDWLYERHLLDQLWRDVNGKHVSWHDEPRAAERPGAALTQLLAQMLEREHRIDLQDF